LVTLGSTARIYPGDLITVRGHLSEPENFDPAFDYRAYLAKDNIYYLIKDGALVDHESRFAVLGVLNRVRDWFVANLESHLPDPAAPLLAGIVLGDRSGLPTELDDLFRVVGLSHIIVLSGYNLTVVGEGVRRSVSFLPLRAALLTSGAALVLFALAAGGGASVARATLMALLVLWARGSGRVYEVGRALVLAALVMLAFNPKLLVFDAGFQLSFLATVGIVFATEPLKHYLRLLPERFGLRDLAATTLAAQLAVLPWIAYLFGNVSLIAFPTNLIVLPAVPLLMFLGMVIGGLGFVPLLPLPVAYLTHLIVVVVIKVSRMAAMVPFASLSLPSLPIVLITLWYAGYYWWWRRAQRVAIAKENNPGISEVV
jgi:competence protein ComEC